ncbi:DUF742 domain-containing protein [Euzebya tangerina]|uniref:DUF742 domain-containing protein n=1 Tax=Euzebya tangerina TaxID=591198 RepID=UPI000E30E3FC|nr:DUF742 domain-containing protein [Euzebya tangerina]
MSAPRRLRAYALTQGRTHVTTKLTLDTLLSKAGGSASTIPGSPEKTEIMRLCEAEPQSPVDLSASLKLPIGTIKVLVADLLASEDLVAGSTGIDNEPDVNLDLDALTPAHAGVSAAPAHKDLTLLEEVLNGIESL